MHRRLALFSITAALATAVPVIAVADSNPVQEQKKPAPKKEASASMTGCIDEQDGHYVLINDRTRDPIADLQAEGFETEGFAKHVGHKVTVRGTSNPSGTRPVFRVRTIETVSETCAPQAPR
jgi:hypothetical protein